MKQDYTYTERLTHINGRPIKFRKDKVAASQSQFESVKDAMETTTAAARAICKRK